MAVGFGYQHIDGIDVGLTNVATMADRSELWTPPFEPMEKVHGIERSCAVCIVSTAFVRYSQWFNFLNNVHTAK